MKYIKLVALEMAGSEQNLMSVMQKTRQRDIIRNRDELCLRLMKSGYSQTQISQFFDFPISTIHISVKRALKNPDINIAHEITDILIQELTNSSEDKRRCVIYHLLKLKGFSYTSIAKFFNIKRWHVYKEADLYNLELRIIEITKRKQSRLINN